MHVLFRADASTAIGSGHVMRCLTLAETLRAQNIRVSFASREHRGHLCDLITARGFSLYKLPAPPKPANKGGAASYADWLGVPWEEDVEQTCRAVEASPDRPDWLVVDHYALDWRWERALRERVGHIMVIDDLADRQHDCDILLDQNLVAGIQGRYRDKVPPTCVQLLGPDYALLQPVYLEKRASIAPRSGSVRRILIFFGGADNENITGRTLSAFLTLNRPDIDVDVVLAPNLVHRAAVRQQAQGYPNVHIHENLPTLAHLMAEASLAVGAGGASSWERLCLGLPALVVTLAENQRPIAMELDRLGLVRWLGHYDTVNESILARALDAVISQGLGDHWSVSCLAAVDGKGLQRVSAALTASAATPLQARRAAADDELLLLSWANDPVTRRNSFSPEPISNETHHNWFRSRLLNSDSSHIFIVETAAGVPLGQARFDRAQEGWKIDYSLAPQFRGRGWGKGVLQAALLKFRAYHAGAVVRGQVKEDNLPSCKVFESLGFELHSRTAGVFEYVYQL